MVAPVKTVDRVEKKGVLQDFDIYQPVTLCVILYTQVDTETLTRITQTE